MILDINSNLRRPKTIANDGHSFLCATISSGYVGIKNLTPLYVRSMLSFVTGGGSGSLCGTSFAFVVHR